MASIYEQARAWAERRAGCTERLESWIHENSGEFGHTGTWVPNEKIEWMLKEIVADREASANCLEDMEGMTEERLAKVRRRAKLLPEELEFLLQQRLESIYHDPCEEGAVFLTELTKRGCPSVWIAYTTSGGGWGRVDFNVMEAFLSREAAIEYLKEYGRSNLW
jgi:hypothetical protein